MLIINFSFQPGQSHLSPNLEEGALNVERIEASEADGSRFAGTLRNRNGNTIAVTGGRFEIDGADFIRVQANE